MSWTATGGFDHTGITGNCFSCHNGSTATGKPPNHVPSPNTCENCHNTMSWTDDRRLRSHGHHRKLRELPQRQHGDGQVAQPLRHQRRLRGVPHPGGLAARALPAHGPELPRRSRGQSRLPRLPHEQRADGPVAVRGVRPRLRGLPRERLHAGRARPATLSELRDCAGACHEGSGRHRVNRGSW